MSLPPKILIYAFTLRRDVASALILKSELEKRGAHAVLACGYNFKLYLKLWKPDIVLISTISKLDMVKELSPDSQVILWPGEGGEPDKSSNARMLSERGNAYDKIDKVLSWGQNDKDLFDKYFPDKSDKVVVCGNPRLDLVKCNYSLLEDRRNKAKSVGFIGRYNSINHFDGRPTIYTLNNPDNLESVIGQAKGYVMMVNVIDYLVKNTDYDISVRPHPLEAPENYVYLKDKYKGRVNIDDSLDIAHWMAGQRVICAPSSTSFLEAYLIKTPIVNIEHLIDVLDRSKEIQPFAALSSTAGNAPTSFEELQEMIKNPPKTEKVKDIEEHLDLVHGYFIEGSACKRMAEAIIPQKQEPKPYTIWLKLLNIVNLLSFKNQCFKNRLFPNFNYCNMYHKTPDYFAGIVKNIDKGNK